jgi:pyruvate formate lyase activating enzyme
MPEILQTESHTDSTPHNRATVGRVFNIQRFSIHDGPGIRTAVFLKGCPLHCLWCHNPEGISFEPSVSFMPDKCLACGECVRICEHEAHELRPSGDEPGAATHLYNREVCAKCGECTDHCDAQALEFVGRSTTVDAVMREVLEDVRFYQSSGGGMTLTGGEPLARFEFTMELLKAARAAGIHCCVETSGFASWKRFETLAPLVDLFLFDFKETDPARHREFTGQSNVLILENLLALHATGARIQLQCPIIPGCNDREDHFAGIAALANSLPHLEGVRLLPYHPLGKSKLARFGLAEERRMARQPMDPTRIDYWCGWLANRGVKILNRSQCDTGPPVN